MSENNSHRRGFLGKLLGGAAVFGISSILAPVKANAEILSSGTTAVNPSEAIFKNLKGKHKLVYDTIAHRNGSGLSWCQAFLNTNNETGTPDKDLNAVIILRSGGIGMAMPDAIWEKYKLGELYKCEDPATKAPAIKNQFFNVTKDDLIEPLMSIDALQKRGVIFCVCKIAIKGNAERIADLNKLEKTEVEKDMLANVLPGIHVVPSGMWALSRAQENGCGFVFVG